MQRPAPLRSSLLGHNGGPPLDGDRPWNEGNFGSYFGWRAAHEAVWKSIPPAIAMRRARKAAALGLTYVEYTLEILDRGRYLQADDTQRIAEIIAARRR